MNTCGIVFQRCSVSVPRGFAIVPVPFPLILKDKSQRILKRLRIKPGLKKPIKKQRPIIIYVFAKRRTAEM